MSWYEQARQLVAKTMQVSSVCGYPGHPDGGHGCHPWCEAHQAGLKLHDGWWVCPGWDGEGCSHYPEPVPDQFTNPAYEGWWRARIAEAGG